MSRIEWTDRTWNPVRGCSRVSEGCRNCYAERMASRFSEDGHAGNDWTPAPFYGFAANGKWTGNVAVIPRKLDEPLRWRKPSRVFVNSMSDLFHEGLWDADIGRVFSVMERADRHTFQVLTKRATRMRDLVSEWKSWAISPPPNVWLGVSVEDQKTADERTPLLLQTPAAKRFVSYEPALGPVDLSAWLSLNEMPKVGRRGEHSRRSDDRVPPPHSFLDWLIVGGESGPGARPCDVAWIRSAVRQAKEAGVPVFVKQLGTRPFNGVDGHDAEGRYEPAKRWMRLAHPKGGDPSEWPEDLRVREAP